MKKQKTDKFALRTAVSACLLWLFPVFVFAKTIPLIIEDVTAIVEAVIPLLFGLAFVYFLWGMYTYIKAASTEGKEGARETIIYGIIGLFVMVSVWGLVNLLNTTFFGSKTTPAAETNANIFKFPGSK